MNQDQGYRTMQEMLDISQALVHEASIAARPGQMDRLEAMAADLADLARRVGNVSAQPHD